MPTLRIIFLFLFPVLFGLFSVRCTNALDCEGELGSSTINPNSSRCKKNCECNNLRYTGMCVGQGAGADNVCISIPRSPCAAPGELAPCIHHLLQCNGIRRCSPDELGGASYWGDCICSATSEEKPPPRREPPPKREPSPEMTASEETPDVDGADADGAGVDGAGADRAEPSAQEMVASDAGESASREQDEPAPDLVKEAKPEAGPTEQGGCQPGATRPCYTGPPGTAGKGICKSGNETCTKQGTWDRCVGEVRPAIEYCNGKDDDCDGTADNACKSQRWPIKLGGSGPNAKNWVTSLALDENDNVYIGGEFHHNVSLDSFTQKGDWHKDLFFFKVSPDGNALKSAWAGKTGHLLHDRLHNMHYNLANKQLYMTGSFTKNANFDVLQIAMANGDQALFWAQMTTGCRFSNALAIGLKKHDYKSFTEGRDIAVDKNLNVYLLAQFRGVFTLNGKDYNANNGNKIATFVLKVDKSGKILWGFVAQGTLEVRGLSLAIDDKGQVYFAGQFTGDAYFDTTTLRTQSTNAFVAKLDNLGKLRWVKQASGSQSNSIQTLTLDKQGQPILGGFFVKSMSFAGKSFSQQSAIPQQHAFVIALDEYGRTIRWSNTIASDKSRVADLHLDASNKLWLTGEFQGKSVFGLLRTLNPNHAKSNLYVARIDPSNGKFQGLERAQGQTDQVGVAVATDSRGDVYTTGTFTQNITLGTKSLSGLGDRSTSFLWKLPPF